MVYSLRFISLEAYTLTGLEAYTLRGLEAYVVRTFKRKRAAVGAALWGL